MFHFHSVKIARWPPGGALADKLKNDFLFDFFSLLKFKVSNRSLFSLISFFFLGTSFFSFSRPRQKIKIGKREFLLYEKMEKRLEDEIDEIIEKEIQNVRKIAQNFTNFEIVILTNLEMSTWKHPK